MWKICLFLPTSLPTFIGAIVLDGTYSNRNKVESFFLSFFYFIIITYMCIHRLGHLPTPCPPACLWAEFVLPPSLILLKRKQCFC
jgi:hypothetical protein